MATKAKTVGLRSSLKRTLQFGLVSVGVSMGKATDDKTRVPGKYLDPETLTPVKQQYVNETGAVVKPVKGYAAGDGFVVLDDDDLEKLDSTDTLALEANVEASSIPAELVETTYLTWPTDATQDTAYLLVSHYLRSYDRAFVGRIVANGTTKVLAICWSDTLNGVVAQMLTYHGAVRWDSAHRVAEYLAAAEQPTAEMQAMAAELFEAIPAEFDPATVVDEYGEALYEAVEAKAAGRAIEGKATATPAPATDLMAALRASLPASAEEANGKVEVIA